MDFKETVTDVIKIRLVPKHGPRYSEPALDHEWYIDVVRQGEDGEDTVRIGVKNPQRNIDYLVYEYEGFWQFERRLLQILHLRLEILDDGVTEFSVV